MTTYNLVEVERLIAEAREDDRQLGEWRHERGSARVSLRDHEDPCAERDDLWLADHRDADAIARTRNNLRVMADQLEAADVEIVSLRDERDAARTEADQLRAQNHSLCEALAAAQAGIHAAKQCCRMMGKITDEALDLLFGLLTSTGPDRMNINDRRVLIQIAERLQRVQREISK